MDEPLRNQGLNRQWLHTELEKARDCPRKCIYWTS